MEGGTCVEEFGKNNDRYTQILTTTTTSLLVKSSVFGCEEYGPPLSVKEYDCDVDISLRNIFDPSGSP